MTKTQTITRWVLLVLVTIAFLAGGSMKVLGTDIETNMFINWGYPIWFMYLVGTCEILGAIGLHIKRVSRFAAIGLIVILIGAIGTHVFHQEGLMAPTPATLLMLFLFGILYIDARAKRQ
jgi:uncharacterized membrane protein YphA (DoxX/SURF4 family)